jgi:hypothetical protein
LHLFDPDLQRPLANPRFFRCFGLEIAVDSGIEQFHSLLDFCPSPPCCDRLSSHFPSSHPFEMARQLATRDPPTFHPQRLRASSAAFEPTETFRNQIEAKQRSMRRIHIGDRWLMAPPRRASSASIQGIEPLGVSFGHAQGKNGQGCSAGLGRFGEFETDM